jgi:hypothetical protein
MTDLQSAAASPQGITPPETSGDAGRLLTDPLTRPASPDPDLARVVDAWPALPAHIRAAVLALVGAIR